VRSRHVLSITNYLVYCSDTEVCYTMQNGIQLPFLILYYMVSYGRQYSIGFLAQIKCKCALPTHFLYKVDFLPLSFWVPEFQHYFDVRFATCWVRSPGNITRKLR